MDGKGLLVTDWAALVNGLTDDVDNTAEGLGTDRHLDGVTGVLDGLTTDETFGGVKSDGTHVVATQVLGDLENEAVLGALNLERVENGRKLALELDIDDGTNNLGNLARGGTKAAYFQRASGQLHRCMVGHFLRLYLRLLASPDSICNEIL